MIVKSYFNIKFGKIQQIFDFIILRQLVAIDQHGWRGTQLGFIPPCFVFLKFDFNFRIPHI